MGLRDGHSEPVTAEADTRRKEVWAIAVSQDYGHEGVIFKDVEPQWYVSGLFIHRPTRDVVTPNMVHEPEQAAPGRLRSRTR